MNAIVTRSTEVPTAVERLAHWNVRSALLRAQAQVGAEHTLDILPHIQTRQEAPQCPPK